MIHFLLFILASSVSPPSAGVVQQGRPAVETAPADAPWGYVYAFRTLRTFPLVGEVNRIGRLPENQIALTSPRVSRRHGMIRRTEEGVEFVDVGSTNGSRVDGAEIRARVPVALEPGDRIQVADELLLYHTSLENLWNTELRLRLLSSMIELNVTLPRDITRTSLGQEEIVTVSSKAILSPEEGTAELKHSVDFEPENGFLQGTPTFVGNVLVNDGTLELSLWSIDAEGSMTSRRAAISRLKHTTLEIVMTGVGSPGPEGPWFPQQYLSNLFDVFPEARDHSLRFATSLASQEQPVALRDAAETLAFRHSLSNDEEWELLVLAARAGGAWVDTAIQNRRSRLTAIEREALAGALEQSRSRLARARTLGAEGEAVDAALSAIERAENRLAALEADRP